MGRAGSSRRLNFRASRHSQRVRWNAGLAFQTPLWVAFLLKETAFLVPLEPASRLKFLRRRC